MKKSRVLVLVLFLITGCIEGPKGTSTCLDTCVVEAEWCFTGAELCFEDIKIDDPMAEEYARDCQDYSHECFTDAISCVAVCIREAEDQL